MADENSEALRTPLGRERMLENHEGRLDGLEGRMKTVEDKEATRDKRWEVILRAVLAIGGGIIVAVASALITGGHL